MSEYGVTAHCYRHPDRETLIRCTRCDRPICPECMNPAAVGFHCPDDVVQGRRTQRAPRTSVGARLRGSPPYVTATLVVLNVLAYLATGLDSPGTLRDPGGSSLFQTWQLQPLKLHNDNDFYELVTAGFLHFSLLHIGSNMLGLVFLGPALEQLLGWWRFGALYLLSLVGGSAAVYAFGAAFTATAGASGAIFGLFAAALVFGRRLGVDMQYLIGVVVLNFAFTFSIAGISKLGHIGGFVVGGLVSLAIGGLPGRRTVLARRTQSAGLASVFALVIAVVAVRTATW